MSDAAKLVITKELEFAALAPGRHMINETITIHVKGSVLKSEDTMAIPTVAIPLKVALALMLEKMGVMRDHAAEILLQSMKEALELGEDAEKKIGDKMKNVESMMDRVKSTLAQMPKLPKAGKCTISKDTVVSIVSVVGEEKLSDAQA